jgi:hypothetical protein
MKLGEVVYIQSWSFDEDKKFKMKVASFIREPMFDEFCYLVHINMRFVDIAIDSKTRSYVVLPIRFS